VRLAMGISSTPSGLGSWSPVSSMTVVMSLFNSNHVVLRM
jgi:hypothetical protein